MQESHEVLLEHVMHPVGHDVQVLTSRYCPSLQEVQVVTLEHVLHNESQAVHVTLSVSRNCPSMHSESEKGRQNIESKRRGTKKRILNFEGRS